MREKICLKALTLLKWISPKKWISSMPVKMNTTLFRKGMLTERSKKNILKKPFPRRGRRGRKTKKKARRAQKKIRRMPDLSPSGRTPKKRGNNLKSYDHVSAYTAHNWSRSR
ncbi:MAG: hypothetical protein [Microviridae sp.]|nr:MAG: hypothetical protein [Microviridae sp.]